MLEFDGLDRAKRSTSIYSSRVRNGQPFARVTLPLISSPEGFLAPLQAWLYS